MAPQAARPVEVFISYSHKDDDLRAELQTHLVMLRRNGVVREWSDRRINAGQEWDAQIDKHLESADIILLLVSPDFLASDYCYDNEVARAMQRHESEEARVIPVILRHCDDWQSAPFGKLQALPLDGRPVKDWPDRDKAFADVAAGIRRAVEELRPTLEERPEPGDEPEKTPPPSLIPRPPVIGFVSRRDPQGRDIVARLKDELAPGRTQLVMLSGPGGIGKTTLAAEASRSLQEAYGGRVVWSSADGRADFTLLSLLDEIATQLGRADLRTLAPAEKEERVRAVASGALVVLDNYETVAEAERARVEAWFRRTRCSALFTSRPRVHDTVFVPVSAMSRGEAAEFLEKLTAQTQDPKIFTLEVRERVYETAEKNPFVMQWVIGQIDLAQEPGAVLEELKHGKGDAARRVFDRSFDLPLLGDDGRDALLALSLFAPSATPDALSAVAGFDDEGRTREAVKNLRRLWLVKGVDGNRRLAVEGLTRSLAAARRSKDPRDDEFRHRLITYYSEYARAHAQPVLENFAALEHEKDNLLQAIDIAFGLEQWTFVLEIMDSLEVDGVRGFLSTRGYWNESLERGEKAREAARRLKNPGAEACYIHNMAYIRRNQGANARDVKNMYDESLTMAESAGNLRLIALILHEKAGLANPEEARGLYEQSLAIKRQVNDYKGIGYSLHELASLNRIAGNFPEASALYTQSLEIALRHEDERGVAGTSLELGWMERVIRHDYREARRLYTLALDIKERWGDRRGAAGALCELGALELDQENPGKARHWLNRSLKLNQQINHPHGTANSLRELGRLELNHGSLTKARRYYERCLTITETLGDSTSNADTMHRLGIIAEKSGDTKMAIRLFHQALSILEQEGSPYAETVRKDLARVEGESS